MTITTYRFTIELLSSHWYVRGFGYEALWDRTGSVGSSFNKV